MRLYEIASGLRELFDASDDGELQPEQLDKLAALELARDEKIDGICGFIREQESQVAARQAEVDRLKKGIQVREHTIGRLKEYLRGFLVGAGEKKIETSLFTIWRQNSPPAVTCEVEPANLPFEYQRTTIASDNKKALETWKATGQAPAGFDVTVNEHLRIK